MKSLSKSYVINSSVGKVWDALTNPETIEKWGAGPAEMNQEKGSEFKIWGGDIFGKNINVIPNKLLEQEWYAGDWKEPSMVTFILNGKGSITKIDLKHVNIPDDEATEIDKGWDEYYLGPIKKLLEED